ncbi:unnamed protein product, partial [Rotaria sordida]
MAAEASTSQSSSATITTKNEIQVMMFPSFDFHMFDGQFNFLINRLQIN